MNQSSNISITRDGLSHAITLAETASDHCHVRALAFASAVSGLLMSIDPELANRIGGLVDLAPPDTEKTVQALDAAFPQFLNQANVASDPALSKTTGAAKYFAGIAEMRKLRPEGRA